MAHDLDDDELKATRESNGADRRGVEEDIKILEEKINNIKKYDTYRYDWTETDIQIIEHLIKEYKELEYKYNKALSDLVQSEHQNKELEIITNGIKVLETNGVNEDTYYVIAKTDFLKGSYKNLLDEYIPKSKVEEKIEEYFEDEEWLVEHDLRALCDDEKECREYYTNKKLALKDIKKAILDKLNKLLKNY